MTMMDEEIPKFSDLPDEEVPAFKDLPNEEPSGHTTRSLFDKMASGVKSSLTSAASTVNETLNPFSEAYQHKIKERIAHPSNVLTDWTGAGRGIGAAMSAIPSAAIAGAAPLVAEPMASAIQAAGEPIAKKLNPNAKVPEHEDVAEAITPDVERALGTFGARGVPAPLTVPAHRLPGPLGVTLTEGQATRNLPLIQREQAAIRGQSGPAAQARAQQFVTQQEVETQAARESVGLSFDPGLSPIVRTPHEAGDIISQSMQQEAAARRANYGQLYRTARDLPGEIHANTFNNMGAGIRADLAANQPTIDATLSPFAHRALTDLDRAPEIMEAVRGVRSTPHFTLDDVDLLRKRLSKYRQGAGANAYDRTATQSVLDAFDDRIDRAVNSGQFNGDPRAVQAWNDARAAYSDYRRTFTAGRKDPIGAVVEKIIGRDAVGDLAAGPAAPNQVADFLYGGTGVNPKNVQIGVANRIRQMFGDASPEWSAVRQGLWSRILERPQGITEWGPRQQANRLNDFLNGKGRDLAQSIYAPPERNLMRSYANLMDQVAVPQAGANWSNTATFVQRTLDRVGGIVGATIGSYIGHAVGLPFGAAEAVGYAASRGAQAIGRYSEVRRVARLMPLVGQQIGRWQRVVNNSYATAALSGSPVMPARLAANITAATNSLNKTLLKLSGPSTVAAQDQQNVPGPPAQQKYGGRINGQKRAHGGKVMPDGEKKTHSSVHYVAKSPHKNKSCARCSMYVPEGPACTLVQSPIASAGYCNRFAGRK